MFQSPATGRRLQPELMDQPELEPDAHYAALTGLRRINRLSRSDAILWPPLRDFLLHWKEPRPARVLDLATGGGDVLLRLARRARQSWLPAEFAGCDMSPRAQAFATEAAAKSEVPVSFFECDVLRAGVPAGYDVLMTSLFLHHLEDAEATRFLHEARAAAGSLLLVNDLLRTRLGRALAWLGPRLLTRSPVVHTDARLSVRAAFTMAEIQDVAREAGLASARFSRHWPERFRMVWVRG